MIIFRDIVTIWINTIPPIYLLIDFFFSKLIFKYRHVIFHLSIGIGFLAMYRLGETMINEFKVFPLKRTDIINPFTPAGLI
mmetsp:Transcript_18943/g.21225  ORF Transcript_18943/g.21225 Transcript_18943/m.21225 type:complete len:81 (+) Transcript_18943:536-778(+)